MSNNVSLRFCSMGQHLVQGEEIKGAMLHFDGVSKKICSTLQEFPARFKIINRENGEISFSESVQVTVEQARTLTVVLKVERTLNPYVLLQANLTPWGYLCYYAPSEPIVEEQLQFLKVRNFQVEAGGDYIIILSALGGQLALVQATYADFQQNVLNV